jgi:hypothetical protein
MLAIRSPVAFEMKGVAAEVWNGGRITAAPTGSSASVGSLGRG